MGGQGAQLDQVVQAPGLDHELTDVDRAEASCDAVENHMQPMPRREHRVDEGAGQVESPTGSLEHPLDQVPHLNRGQDRRRQLVAAVAGDEHPLWLIDPDLLHRGVVQIALQRSEARHARHQLVDDCIRVTDRTHHSRQAPLVVGQHRRPGEAPYRVHLREWVHPAAANLVAHVGVQQLQRRRAIRQTSTNHDQTFKSATG